MTLFLEKLNSLDTFDKLASFPWLSLCTNENGKERGESGKNLSQEKRHRERELLTCGQMNELARPCSIDRMGLDSTTLHT